MTNLEKILKKSEDWQIKRNLGRMLCCYGKVDCKRECPSYELCLASKRPNYKTWVPIAEWALKEAEAE